MDKDNAPKRHHKFHAEATTLEGELHLPFAQKTCSHTASKLNENGGYVTQHADRFHLGGVINFRSSYTHVGGNLDSKPDHGWNTITTAVIEGLNVMEVVTADRVVAQISTDHPLEGYVPRVTFLGTRIENLRIAGSEPLKIHFNHAILGDKPANDAGYTTDSGFIQRVSGQYETIRKGKDLPAELAGRYNQNPSGASNRGSVECSLVNQVEGSFPGRSCGHILFIPDFGKVHLATLKVEHSDYNDKGIPKQTTISLVMLRCEMGCIGGGVISLGGGKTNGQSGP
ncbi:MAG: hypothetical protein JST28_17245 [Acidobacteria bacterium]|nr:hypothetical protein [Acidobacteriota bacterium]